MVDQDAALDLIDQLRVAVPEEVRAAKRINSEGERIIEKAQEEAEQIVARAQEQAAFLIEERGLTQAAEAESRGSSPRPTATPTRSGAAPTSTPSSVLVGLEGDVVQTLQSIKKGIQLLDERRADAGRERTSDRATARARRWEDEAEETPSQPSGRDRPSPPDGPLGWNVAGLLGDERRADRVYDVARRHDRPAATISSSRPDRGPRPADPTNRGSSSTPARHGARRGVQPLPARRRGPARARDRGGGPARRSTSRPAGRCRSTTSPTPAPDRPPRARPRAPVRDAIRSPSRSRRSDRRTAPGLCVVCGEPLDEGVHDHPRTTSTRGSRRCAGFTVDDDVTTGPDFAVDSAVGRGAVPAVRQPDPRPAHRDPRLTEGARDPMGVPKRRVSHARQGERRAHLAIEPAALEECPHCHETKQPHHVCPNCGYYNGRLAIELKTAARRRRALIA